MFQIVVDAVLVFTATAMLTYVVTLSVRRCVHPSPNGGNKGDMGEKGVGEEEGDTHHETDDAPLCKTCHQISYPPERGPGKEIPRHASRGNPHRALLRGESGRMLFSDVNGQFLGGIEEKRDSTGLRRMASRKGLDRYSSALSDTA